MSWRRTWRRWSAATGEMLNIGTGVQTTDQGVYDAVAAAVGFDEPPIYGDERTGDVRHSCIDASRAKRSAGLGAAG